MTTTSLSAVPGDAKPDLLSRVLLPFALGYFLSYLLRTINAIIAPDLIAAYRLSASEIGLLTSVYFLAFTLSQPLLGVLLDRFGPRRVEGYLILSAGAGSLLFAWGETVSQLILGRGLIGLGVSACLMGAFKANTLWFPRGELAAYNGLILAAGGLGAIFSTAPAEFALQWITWRELFTVFALAFFSLGLGILRYVPERPGTGERTSLPDLWRGFAVIGGSRVIWRVAPVAMLSQSTYLAIQSLWAAGWMRDVGGFGREEIALYLFLAAAAMAAGHLTMGNIATRLEKRGVTPSYVVGVGVGLAIVVQMSFVWGFVRIQPVVWFLFGFLGTAGTVSFAILARQFPLSLSGRVNTALNLLIFIAAFLIQWGMGLVIDLFPLPSGGNAKEGYALAFGITAFLQAVFLFWFFRKLPPCPSP